MITFDREGARFTFRTAAVFADRGHVLLHQAAGEDFWALPGGRVEFGEAAGAALQREMLEEIGQRVRPMRLLWVVENFFEDDSRPHQELGLYFLATLSNDSPYRDLTCDHSGLEDTAGDGSVATLELIYRWFPLADLATTPLYPTFLRQGLQALPIQTTHLVHQDP